MTYDLCPAFSENTAIPYRIGLRWRKEAGSETYMYKRMTTSQSTSMDLHENKTDSNTLKY